MPIEENQVLEKNVCDFLDTLEHGAAVFSADRKLLHINKAMAAVTGGDQSKIGLSLSDLGKEHRLRDTAGRIVEPKDFPIEKAFLGIETRNEVYLYISPTRQHFWLDVSCRVVRNDDESVRYVITTIEDVTAVRSEADKLHLMVESAKILALTENFRERLVQKAKLTVPALADWCAIDLLSEDGALERVALIHGNPEMLAYVNEYEKKYPTDHSLPTSIRNTIATMTPLFIPAVTDEMIHAGAKDVEQEEDIKKLRLSSIMQIPILAGGVGLGCLSLAYAESGRIYTQADYNFFVEFCLHLGVLLDNSRLYEEIAKRDTAKDLFLASLSHELRNPLAPIKSSLEYLGMTPMSDEVREGLEAIEHQFDHMARLLNDLLDVTRFTQSRISIQPGPMDLRSLVERSLKATDSLLNHSNLALHFTFDSAPICIMGDSTRLEQAITNLTNNAAKFTAVGGTIWVDVVRDGDSAVIKIRDNGIGIEKDDLPKIFDMYYQGRNKGRQTGLGIGLLLVQKIVELHGGTIVAHSAGRGCGSEFVVRLPIHETVPSKEVPQVSALSKKGKKILVVDDNMPAADMLVKLLNALGNCSEAAYSGSSILSRDLSQYDVVLLDIGMPQMDGFQTLKELKSTGLQTPVVALTGYGLISDKERTHEAGFTAHLTKPISKKDLDGLFDTIFVDSA